MNIERVSISNPENRAHLLVAVLVDTADGLDKAVKTQRKVCGTSDHGKLTDLKFACASSPDVSLSRM